VTVNDSGNSAPKAPRGKPFAKGNPGKPKGVRNKATELAEKLLSKDIKKVIEVVRLAAKEGDMVAAKLILDRIAPPPKHTKIVQFEMQPISCIGDISGALSAFWVAYSSGQISVDEMHLLVQILEKHASILHAEDHERRLVALEESKVPKLEYRNAP
jgi:hypothetical protein